MRASVSLKVQNAGPSAARSSRTRLALCALLSLSIAGAGLLSPQIAQAAIVERIVAVVGPKAILLTDIRDRALPILVRVYSQVPEGPQRAAAISQVYGAIVQKMVDEELEEEAARKAGVVVSTTEIDEALARVSAQNNMSVNQILSEAKRSGLTVEAYKDELRRQLLQAKMGQLRLSGRVRVQEADLKAAYKRLLMQERMQQPQRTLRLRIGAGGSDAEQAEQRRLAESLADRVTEGEDLRELIEQYATRAGSGLSPSAPPLQEAKNIQRATMALDVGETSRPVRDGADWVIVQVIERAPSQIPPYEEVREEVHQQVYMEKMETARKHWIEGLRRRTHVEIRL